MNSPPTGTVSFLFTDVQSSTRLWEHHDDEMDLALADHDRILRSAIEDERGYVFSTAGDAFAAAFDSAPAACRAALTIQDRLAEQDWPTPEPIHVRIGLHVGEAHEREGDYFGPTLNRAARIMSAAHGGQVVASAAFTSLATTDAMIDLGRHRLKDLAAPENLWQLNAGSFGRLRTLDAARHNLPVERTALVGRDAAIAHLVGRLGEERIVTLLGIGGAGKTRVAVATGAELVDRFPDGVWFVDLVPTDDTDDVTEAIADAAGLRLTGHDMLGTLAATISDRRTLFLVDNCEHVTDHAAQVLEYLLERTTEPRFLATSREPLDIIDECRVALDPLPVAPEATSPAIRLFVDTAARIGAQLDDADLDIVADVCSHLDGHPLSIELAAAQLKQLTLDQLRDHLGERFELLARGRRRSRHANLLGVLESTWDMLDDEHRQLLIQLAAFPAGFGLDEIVGVTQELEVGNVTRTLGGLVDRSLVASDGLGRFRLLETIRLFARQQAGDEPFERHAQWLLGHLASQPAEDRHSSRALHQWILDHDDDWRAVEDRLAEAGRWTELSDLLRFSSLFFHFASGTRAMAQIGRIERYLTKVPPDDDAALGAFNLIAANAGLPARRPDWIERGARAAVGHLREFDPVDLAAAQIADTWMIALREPHRAVRMLAGVFDRAETAGAPNLANVALGYEAVALALAGEDARLAERLDELERRLDPATNDYGRRLFDTVSLAFNVVKDPNLSWEVSCRDSWQMHDTDPATVLLGAVASAAIADAAEAVERLDRTLEVMRYWSADDGLPDLLVVPATLAHASEDHARCRHLLTAIRRSPVPTQNFLVTIIFRQLRAAVGLDDGNPLDSQPIDEIFGEARDWMRELVRHRAS